MEDLNTLHEEMQQSWAELKGLIEKKNHEVHELGHARALTLEAIDRLNDRLDDVEIKMNRPPAPSATPAAAPSEEQQTFLNWARKGFVPSEGKALTAANDATGGYLAPAETTREIIKDVTEMSPIRSVARVRETSHRSVLVPKRTGQFSAQWVAETGARSETSGLSYGLEEVPTHELYALVDISQQDLEDSEFDLERELHNEFAEQFAGAEGAAFVNGDGVTKPEGLLANSAVAFTAAGDASKITADGMIALCYDLKDAYAKHGVWVLKRSTLKAIRQLKADGNQYLWQPGLAGGAPATILDCPYVEASDMPAVAAGAFPVLFGDIARAYLVVDRVQIAVQRDPYTQATSGVVRFIARKRVGGQVVLPEAVRKLKIAA